MIKRKIYLERRKLIRFLITGAILGFFYSLFEFFIRDMLGDPQPYLPMVIRACLAGALIYSSVLLIDLSISKYFAQRRFVSVVLLKSLLLTVLISFWLVLINSAWFLINSKAFYPQFMTYLTGNMFMVNVVSVFGLIIVLVTIGQINSLHRRGELFKFIVGSYHQPKEVDRIFAFIDLKGSTTIAEKLGHELYASFIKDYYSDISEAILSTDAQIYQYVGDEIVLSWSFKKGLRQNNAIRCFFYMKDLIEEQKSKYMEKYGLIPEFRAGLHGGDVIVTWIGEVKKEIVYIGDVLNTAARIQEDCKRLSNDYLVSYDLLQKVDDLEDVLATFIEETVPRGKATRVKLYSLELAE